MLPSYPHVYNLGHAAIQELLLDPVVVQEKVDGSQFSFGRQDGKTFARSRGADIDLDNPPEMFKKAVEVVNDLDLRGLLLEEWIYRGECLSKPKHNALTYGRVPHNNIILFDVNRGGPECYLPASHIEAEAKRLGLEAVPLLFEGMVTGPDQIRDFLERESVLGGVKVEGVVIKNYARFGRDKHVLMGKIVCEAFKELNRDAQRAFKPGKSDVIQGLINTLRTEARWRKAVQHLREAGSLTDEPKDIGAIIKEVGRDLEEECAEMIKETLFKGLFGQIRKGAGAGVAEWYKNELMKRQFDTPAVLCSEGIEYSVGDYRAIQGSPEDQPEERR